MEEGQSEWETGSGAQVEMQQDSQAGNCGHFITCEFEVQQGR